MLGLALTLTLTLTLTVEGVLEPEGVVVDVWVALELGVPLGGGLRLELLPHGVPDAEPRRGQGVTPHLEDPAEDLGSHKGGWDKVGWRG